jgi:hypothetical protein
VVDERDTVNPSAFVPADNPIDALLYKLLFKFLFAVGSVVLRQKIQKFKTGIIR